MQIQGTKYEVNVSVCKDIAAADVVTLKQYDGAVLVYSVVDKKSLTYLKTIAFQKLHEGLNAPDKSASDKEAAGTDANQLNQQVGAEGNGQDIAETPTGQPDDVGLSVPVILIGNKVDDAKLARAIETEDAEALSKELRCTGFFETAATCNAKVPEAFQALLEEIVTRKLNAEEDADKPVKPTNACCILQ